MRLMRKWILALCVVVALGTLSACTSTVERVTDAKMLDQFAFLQPGVTTDAEVRARFGEPRNVYEDGRVATYNLSVRRGQYMASTDTSGLFLHLVLVYGSDGVLERWSLVRER